MSDLEIYCVTNKRINILENFKYKLAIVGSEKFENNYLRSDKGKNIFDKEKYYSELLFIIGIGKINWICPMKIG